MKMKHFFMIVCLVSRYSIIRCSLERKKEGSNICNVNNLYYTDDTVCHKDGSGYVKWHCKDIDKTDDYVWIKGKTTMCEKGHSCRCWEDGWGTKFCECYNPRKPPSFTSTGVIRWNGTFYHDDNWWKFRENPRTVYTPGEIHKDARGRFLYKWTEIGRWPEGKALPDTKVQFKILIPNGDKAYLRYTGDDDGNKLCSKDVVKYKGDLNAIWKKHYRFGKTFTLHDSKQKKGSKNVDIENWRLLHKMEDAMEEWKWTIEYNSLKDRATPLKYYHRIEDGFGGRLQITELNYTYESLNKDDESFKLEDYCNV